MNCLECGNKISGARLKILPDTDYCVGCSSKNAQPFVARMIYNHKTAGEVILAKGKENVRLLNREYTRAR